jgi:hypothetical protein
MDANSAPPDMPAPAMFSPMAILSMMGQQHQQQQPMQQQQTGSIEAFFRSCARIPC